jgi:hypothetical protein
VVQKSKNLELAQWCGFLLKGLCPNFDVFQNRLQAKHLSVTENPKLRSCCQPEPVRVSGLSAKTKQITP